MTKKYETLDEYLDDLDKIKERLAEETAGMDVKQLDRFFAESHKRFEQKRKRLGLPLEPPRDEPPSETSSRRGAGIGKKYETLDEYLDDLDKIKERLAEKLQGMNAQEVTAYFAGSRARLERTAKKARARKRKTAPR